MLIEGLSLYPAELSLPFQGILRCGHTIWVFVSLPWLGDHHALQLHSGFCCEPLGSSLGICKSSIASHLKGLDPSLDFCTRNLTNIHSADLDLIDKDRIYKWKGALSKLEMTKDRVDHKPNLSLLSLSHISGIFIFYFRNYDLPRILGKRALSGQNVI